jgi:hypothetical protein
MEAFKYREQLMHVIPIATCIITLYSSTQAFEIDLNTNKKHPPDVSFAIIDLKYDHGNLKICEFGEAFYCDLSPYFEIHTTERLCTYFGDFFQSLKMPRFLVTSDTPREQFSRPTAYAKYVLSGFFWDFIVSNNSYNKPHIESAHLAQSQNVFYDTLDDFIDKSESISAFKQNQPTKIMGPSGILIAKDLRFLAAHYHMLREKYPNLILLDYATSRLVQNKLLTHLLFAHDSSIEKYRPRCRILSRKYTQSLARSIIAEIPSECYVIKPIDSCSGRGVIFVEQQHLAHALYLILNPIQITSSKKDYLFWKKYRKNFLLVESFEPSQPIMINEKHYDATMRVVFGMAYDGNNITINFFDAYWKLPERALEDEGSLAEKHKSHVRLDMKCAVKVDPQTYKEVTDILQKILPTIYFKMIAASNTPHLLENLSRKIHGPSTDIYAYQEDN